MNNDLISREALRKDIEHLHSVYVDNKDWFYTDVLNHIDNAPAVLPKGHGDLIDRDVARNILNDLSFNCGELLRYVSTVIPADKNDNDEIIDNAPTFTPKVEFVTKNGITFPKALETMTFSHELTTEERQNIERAYMLGVYSNERPQGEWIIDGHHIRCNKCNEYICTEDREGNSIPDNFCPFCGADMRKGGAE